MWREYTRDKPARRGLAIVATALGLGGTTALAYYVTNQRETHDTSATRLAVPGWPVSFMLPKEWRLVDRGGDFDGFLRDGMQDELLFGSAGLTLEPDALRIAYRLFDTKAKPPDALRHFTGMQPESSDSISMGPFEGYFVRMESTTSREILTAVGMDSNGLAVCIELHAAQATGRQLRAFRRLCGSLDYDDWFVKVGTAAE